MNIYLISQTVNDDYDTYDSAVVCAESSDAARLIHPHPTGCSVENYDSGDWAYPADVSVKCIGVAKLDTPEGVICSSFNAG